MPTIGNMPRADVTIANPWGDHVHVNMIRLLVQAQDAEFYVKFGEHLPGVGKLRPTLKAYREQYEGIIVAKTWKDAAVQLRGLHTAITEALEAAR